MRKQDVIVAKNYLSVDEIDTLNRLVVIFLEQAELRVKQQQDLTLGFWQSNLDKMLAFNDQPILEGAGNISHDDMRHIVQTRYNDFDQKRRRDEALKADAEDLKILENLDRSLKNKGKDKSP